MNYSKELQVAKLAARRAGVLLMKKFNTKNNISYKKHNELVTDTDKAADKIITKIIKSAFPNHNILSEESKHKKTKDDHMWIIDPIDGTNNFVHGFPIFAICIAMACKDGVKVGVTYLPYFKEMYWGVEGNGAYLGKKKIKISETSDLNISYIAYDLGHDPKAKKKGKKILSRIDNMIGTTRQLGCAGYEIAKVASGNIDAGFIVGTRPWDSASGSIILQEAGGIVTNFKGKKWNIFDSEILFSNKKLHKKVLKII